MGDVDLDGHTQRKQMSVCSPLTHTLHPNNTNPSQESCSLIVAPYAGYAKSSPKAAKGQPPNSVTLLPKEQQDPNSRGTGDRSVKLRTSKGPREDSATPSFTNFIQENNMGPAFTIETLDQLERDLNILPPTQVKLEPILFHGNSSRCNS
jgi:hypothetical protein